jgi:transposase
MAVKLDLMDIRQILMLKQSDESNRQVATTVGVNRNTVNHYVSLFRASGLSYSELLELDNGALHELFPERSTSDGDRYLELSSHFEDIKTEHLRPGFTFQYYWRQYRLKHPSGYGYTQFLEHYHRWEQHLNSSMKLDHRAGQKLFIDYTGKHLHIIDKETGQVQDAEVFVAILPASQYTYVEASSGQTKADFLASMGRCLAWFGGAPQAIVTDNLKSAVTKTSKYAPQINRCFKDFALHYGSVVDPTRPYSPQDKALVEGAVKLVYQRIFYPLSKMQFFSLHDLNKHIKTMLETYNDYRFQRMDCSRKELFLSTEKSYLKPLPAGPYELKEYRRLKVQKTGHIYLNTDKHYYSVPYRFIGRQVEVAFGPETVEIFDNHQRIATHKRDMRPGSYTSQKEHLCSTHRAYSDWSPEYFIGKAERKGLHVKTYIEGILNQYAYPEQAYKQSMGIIQLAQGFTAERLDNACQRALQMESYGFHHIKSILEKGLDRNPELWDSLEEKTPHITEHENTRGSEAYK